MKIQRILAGLKEEKAPAAGQEKIAADKTTVSPAPREALVSALERATATTKTAAEKPAVAAGPVDEVMKVATELAASEKEAAVKEAQLLGEAFMDGAIARLGTWQKEAQAMVEAAPAPTQAELQKAAEEGYRKAQADLEKLAQDEYDRGWNETVETIFKTAEDEFMKATKLAGLLCDAAK